MTIQEIKTQFLTANSDVDVSKVDEVIAKTIERMSIAFREDRARLFRVIDSMRPQPRFADKLADIETIAQQWRDIPQGVDFPNITHPASLPEWFERVSFFSRWEKDEYLLQELKERLVE